MLRTSGRMMLISVLGAAGLIAGGCASAPQTAGGAGDAGSPAQATVMPVASTTPVNAVCPIGKHEITEAGGTHRFGEHVVGFCCEGCYDAWPAMSRAERAAKLAAVMPAN